jgi:hypothetical protein
MIDLQFDPYKRNYVITMEVSPELAATLENDPEAMKALMDSMQSAILAAFSHTRPARREETR